MTLNTIVLNPASYTVHMVAPADTLYSFVQSYVNEDLEKGYKVTLHSSIECILYKGFDGAFYILYPTHLIHPQEVNKPAICSFTCEHYALFIVTQVDKKIMYDHTMAILEEK